MWTYYVVSQNLSFLSQEWSGKLVGFQNPHTPHIVQVNSHRSSGFEETRWYCHHPPIITLHTHMHISYHPTLTLNTHSHTSHPPTITLSHFTPSHHHTHTSHSPTITPFHSPTITPSHSSHYGVGEVLLLTGHQDLRRQDEFVSRVDVTAVSTGSREDLELRREGNWTNVTILGAEGKKNK